MAEDSEGRMKPEHPEETQNIDATDDFDPFGNVDCTEESIDIQLSAPPENQ